MNCGGQSGSCWAQWETKEKIDYSGVSFGLEWEHSGLQWTTVDYSGIWVGTILAIPLIPTTILKNF